LNYINSIKNIKETINSIISLTENNFCLISSDSTIKIYNNENSILTLSGHTNKVISVIMLNNKKRLVSISNDSTIRIWDISNGENIKTINTYNLPMIILEIKGKENLIAELNLGNKIDIYDINSGEKIFNKTIQEFNWFESFYQLNNKDYLLGKFESVFIYNENLELKKEKKICGQTPINYLEISNGDIFIGSREGLIFVFDNLYNFKCKLLGHQETISGIIDYNEKYIMTCSYDTSIKIWEKNNYECENTFEGNSYQIISMIKITNGNIVTISLNPENIIDFWKLEEF
jgi:WD40 repeat protein